MEIEKNNAVAFTGHRQMELNFDAETLKNIIEQQIKQGKNTFLVGMAIGFDTICFQILERLRKKYPIKLIACVPCPEQSSKFCNKDRLEYNRMISSADEVVNLSQHYDNFCMMRRNKFMVDNCSILIAYYRNIKGGTYATINYAKQNGVETLLI